NGIGVAGLRKFVQRLALHAFALRVGKFLVEIGKALRGDILLVVNLPNLILAFVFEAGVFRVLYFELQIVQLVGKPRRGLCDGLVAAAEIVFLEIFDVGIDDAGRELRVSRFERDVQQTAIGNSADAETPEECRKLGWAFMVGQTAGSDRLRRAVA